MQDEYGLGRRIGQVFAFTQRAADFPHWARNASSVFFCFALCVGGSTQLWADPAPDAEGVTAVSNAHALLIGINDYSAVPDLYGTHNDVERMRTILQSKFGFRDFEVLEDAQATRENILAALRRIVAKAQPGHRIYIHFSGHGSRVKDQNGDEVDGYDESILSYDARQAGIRDILDDELYEILNQMRADAAVVVLDACHSGDGTRDVAIKRSVAEDPRVELYAPSVAGATDGTGTRAVTTVSESDSVPWVLFTGAAASQKALDVRIDGEPVGLFTYAFSRALTRLDPGESAAGVMRALKQELARQEASCSTTCPEPQLEGTAAQIEQPIFGAFDAVAPAASRSFAAVASAAGDTVLLEAAALGARAGDVWSVYSSDETAFAPAAELGRVRVVELRGANARIVGEAGFVAERDQRAIPVSLANSGSPRVALRLEGLAEARVAALERELRASLGDLLGFATEGPVSLLASCDPGGSCVLLGANGSELRRAPVGELAPAIEHEVRRRVALEHLRALDPASPEISLTMSVVGLPDATRSAPEEAGQRGLVTQLVNEPRRLVIRPRPPFTEENALQFEFLANEDCYLTVLAVDEDARTDLLFPRPEQDLSFMPDARLRANQPKRVPDELAGGRAGFVVTFVEPPGRATAYGICTREEEDARRLRAAVVNGIPDPLKLPTELRGLMGSGDPGMPAVGAAKPAQGVGAGPAPQGSRGLASLATRPRSRSTGARVQLRIERE